jgi:hypothetical protein
MVGVLLLLDCDAEGALGYPAPPCPIAG